MIRSNLPLPFLYRLRLQAGAAARRAGSGFNYRDTRDGAGRAVTARSAAARRTGSATDAGQLWTEFVEQYERFTGILCAAAQYGCDASKESEYAQMRHWFVANYYRIAARVRPYLETEFADEAGSDEAPVVTDYAGQRRALDVLEALFMPPSLRDVLRHDTGNLIPRIARLSETIYRCHEDWQASQ